MAKQSLKKKLTRGDIEKQLKALREQYEKDAIALDNYIKDANATVELQKAQLLKLQAQYQGLQTLFDNYSW